MTATLSEMSGQGLVPPDSDAALIVRAKRAARHDLDPKPQTSTPPDRCETPSGLPSRLKMSRLPGAQMVDASLHHPFHIGWPAFQSLTWGFLSRTTRFTDPFDDMFKSKGAVLSVLLLLAVLCTSLVEAAPKQNGGNKQGGQGGKGVQNNKNQNKNSNGGGGQGQNRATQTENGVTTIDKTVEINGLQIRYKLSGPTAQFNETSGVSGANGNPDGALGINVLLHGDGGQSFFAFPNQGVRDNLMGVAVLSPDKNRKWGGADAKNQQRVDGEAHAQAVNDLIQQELPKMIAFDQKKVFFTGVSGGALTLAGFVIPAHMGNFPNSGVMLNCGAMSPQLKFTPESAAAIATTRIHFQSTQKELNSLQGEIPESIKAYIEAGKDAGLSQQDINRLQTVDNSPNGGHCAFDGQDFESGVQLMADSFGDVMLDGGSGQVDGIGSVLKGAVGNQNLKFKPGERK
ncbi:Cyclin-like F-box [Ophiocordyceps sinensis CO18]|uniref:Cyclin-like F-box n=1 Tax=Ophiocordyceps sinensis (strain Co18 / CGMCC 3.14243) TaxID=911162 RepID=T4ZY58_OPHSC|nr:Cyclin-like F-box [Ophiocordyceps sinensis CO18]